MTEPQFCRRNFLSSATLANIEDLKAQLLGILVDEGFIQQRGLKRHHSLQKSHSRQAFTMIEDDINNDNADLVQSVIAWSLYPKILVRDGKGYRSLTNQSISIHPTSILRSLDSTSAQYFSYYSILQTSGAKLLNANSITPTSALPLLLLVGDATFHPTAQIIALDSRLRFVVEQKSKAFIAIKIFRLRIAEIIARYWKSSKTVEMPRRLQKWVKILMSLIASWGVPEP